MADEKKSSTSPTIPENSRTEQKSEARTTPTKKPNSRTMKKGSGLNKVKQDELLKWTVFVQQETKTAVGMAAAKAGITVTDWLDSRLREAATTELTTKPQPPARLEDMADLMQRMTEQLKADQEAAAKAQSDLIKQQGEQIAQLAASIDNRPASLKEMLFGKRKSPQGE